MYYPRVKLYTAQVQWAGYRVISLPVDAIMDVWPSEEYPHGNKAFHMSEIWNGIKGFGHPGILWLDPDVAADPDDLAAMERAVDQRPGDMHTGLVKLWPESTQLPRWIWSHRGGTLGFPAATQEVTDTCSYVATGFLWTPARLLDLVFPAHQGLQWEQVDVTLSEAALAAGIPARVARACQPKHLHFSREHDGFAILRRTTAGASDQGQHRSGDLAS